MSSLLKSVCLSHCSCVECIVTPIFQKKRRRGIKKKRIGFKLIEVSSSLTLVNKYLSFGRIRPNSNHKRRLDDLRGLVSFPWTAEDFEKSSPRIRERIQGLAKQNRSNTLHNTTHTTLHSNTTLHERERKERDTLSSPLLCVCGWLGLVENESECVVGCCGGESYLLKIFSRVPDFDPIDCRPWGLWNLKSEDEKRKEEKKRGIHAHIFWWLLEFELLCLLLFVVVVVRLLGWKRKLVRKGKGGRVEIDWNAVWGNYFWVDQRELQDILVGSGRSCVGFQLMWNGFRHHFVFEEFQSWKRIARDGLQSIQDQTNDVGWDGVCLLSTRRREVRDENENHRMDFWDQPNTDGALCGILYNSRLERPHRRWNSAELWISLVVKVTNWILGLQWREGEQSMQCNSEERKEINKAEQQGLWIQDDNENKDKKNENSMATGRITSSKSKEKMGQLWIIDQDNQEDLLLNNENNSHLFIHKTNTTNTNSTRGIRRRRMRR